MGVGAGGSACVGEQHQREQAGQFAVVGPAFVQLAGQAEGFGGEVDADQVVAGARGRALGEDQVEHVQNGRQVLGWAELRAGLLDLLLGAADPLCHRCFRYQESPGDLRCRQAADRPEGEGDLGGGGEAVVAAQGEDRERVVARRDGVGWGGVSATTLSSR